MRDVAAAATGAASRHRVGGAAASGARAASSSSRQRLVQTDSAAPGLFVRVFDGVYQPIPAGMKARACGSPCAPSDVHDRSYGSWSRVSDATQQVARTDELETCIAPWRMAALWATCT